MIKIFDEIIKAYEIAMLKVDPNAPLLSANGVENPEMIKIIELQGHFMTLISLILLKTITKVND